MIGSALANDVFAAISAPARREIMQMLSHRDIPVTEIAESFDMSMSAVSQHLTVLKSAGLVTQIRAGRQRIYHLNPEPLQEVADWLTFYEPFWKQRLDDLGRYLDEAQ